MSVTANFLRAAVAAAAFVTSAAVVQADQMTVTSWVGPRHVMNSRGLEPFNAWMRSQGYTVKFYPGGSLLNAKTTLSGLGSGVTDLAVVSYTFTPAELPNVQLIADIGFLFSSGMAAAAAEYQLLHCPDCLDDFRRRGVVFIAGHATSTYALMSSVPIRKPEDLKGRKMRVAGSTWSRWARYVGGVDVSMPAADMFDALSKGVIDIAIHAPNSMRAFSLWDVAKYMTLADLGAVASVGTFVFNQDFWRSVKPELRQQIANQAVERIVDVTMGYAQEDAEVVKEARKRGVEVIEPSPELAGQKQAFVAADLDMIAKHARAVLKIKDAEKKLKVLTGLAAKWEKLITAKTPRDQVIALLHREIFDKVDFKTYGAK
jgi:TRAP-type C4-dicarboxylate transport system substrate-binding protein